MVRHPFVRHGILLWALLAAASTPKVAVAFALIGPNGAEGGGGVHGPANPAVGLFQDFGAGYRWSETDISYSVHADVATAFGNPGLAAIDDAFDTWDAAYGANAQHAGILQGAQPVADLESIVLHEIGHALGLHHPDKAIGDFGQESRNFDSNGNPVGVDLDAVMRSDLEAGEINRLLTQDDIDGLMHLYDPANTFSLFGRNAQNQVAVVTGTPPGNFSFTEQGAAVVGGTVGANIDVFMMHFADPNVKAQTWIYGGVGGAGGFVTANGVSLGGFFDGTPENLHAIGRDNASHGQNLVSIDIFINSNPAAQVGLNTFLVPEPGTVTLLGTGLLAVVRQRRRWKRTQIRSA